MARQAATKLQPPAGRQKKPEAPETREVSRRAANKRHLGRKTLPPSSRVHPADRERGLDVNAYLRLSARELIPRLGELTTAQVRKLRDYERQHKARKGLMAHLTRRLSEKGQHGTARM